MNALTVMSPPVVALTPLLHDHPLAPQKLAVLTSYVGQIS